MKPGELRKFVGDLPRYLKDNYERNSFIVLKVTPFKSGRTVDILLDGSIEEGLGYFWVEDNSEALNETV